MSARYYREPEPCLACVQRHRSGISPTILFSGFLFPLNDGTARQTSVSLVRIKPIVKAPSMPQSQILWVVSSKTPLFATLHLENVALPLPAIVVYPVPVQPPVRVSPHLRSVTVRVSVWYVSIPAVPRRTVFSLVFFFLLLFSLHTVGLLFSPFVMQPAMMSCVGHLVWFLCEATRIIRLIIFCCCCYCCFGLGGQCTSGGGGGGVFIPPEPPTAPAAPAGPGAAPTGKESMR